MMGCFVAGCLSLICGRLYLALVWIFSNWFNRAFDGAWEWVAPLIGLFFAPVTVLYCSAVYNWWGGEWNLLQILGLLVALCIDSGSAEGGSRKHRKRRRRDED